MASSVGVILYDQNYLGSVIFIHRASPCRPPAKADWLCGADQCVWVTYNVVSVPAYAVTWAPPTNPNCYWKQGIFGRWKYICP